MYTDMFQCSDTTYSMSLHGFKETVLQLKSAYFYWTLWVRAELESIRPGSLTDHNDLFYLIVTGFYYHLCYLLMLLIMKINQALSSQEYEMKQQQETLLTLSLRSLPFYYWFQANHISLLVKCTSGLWGTLMWITEIIFAVDVFIFYVDNRQSMIKPNVFPKQLAQFVWATL